MSEQEPVQSERLIGDSYHVAPQELGKLRTLAKRLGVSKSELIRRAVRALIRSYDG